MPLKSKIKIAPLVSQRTLGQANIRGSKELGTREPMSSVRKGMKRMKESGRIMIKAATKGVHLGQERAEALVEGAKRSHGSPLRKIAGKLKGKLPRGPRTLLGSFAIPGAIKKVTEATQAQQRLRRSKLGYIKTKEM